MQNGIYEMLKFYIVWKLRFENIYWFIFLLLPMKTDIFEGGNYDKWMREYEDSLSSNYPSWQILL